ncbi:MAG: DUF3142 domain-containing protein [Deltaproteobacteria bacterium]|nr:DUF3142 domain-containing protein [Deltaproteobacteria bacterium]
MGAFTTLKLKLGSSMTTSVELTDHGRRRMISIAALSALALVVIFINFGIKIIDKRPSATFSARLAGFPMIMLWAWERPEKIDFIDTRRVGVAFLMKTIYLHDNQVVIRHRLNPLQYPPGTALMAVARIEVPPGKAPVYSPDQESKVVAELLAISRLQGITAIQIDFDARVSARNFYRRVLLALRRQLPDSIALSITALASWGTYDRWLSNVKIDEAATMLFRMGPDRELFLQRLRSGQDFSPSMCRLSYGISTDEPLDKSLYQFLSRRRIYIFHPKPWTQGALTQVLEEMQ